MTTSNRTNRRVKTNNFKTLSPSTHTRPYITFDILKKELIETLWDFFINLLFTDWLILSFCNFIWLTVYLYWLNCIYWKRNKRKHSWCWRANNNLSLTGKWFLRGGPVDHLVSLIIVIIPTKALITHSLTVYFKHHDIYNSYQLNNAVVFI